MNRQSDGKLEKMGPQNRKHTLKMSCFRVMGQIRETKKLPISQITKQNIFWGLGNGTNRSA